MRAHATSVPTWAERQRVLLLANLLLGLLAGCEGDGTTPPAPLDVVRDAGLTWRPPTQECGTTPAPGCACSAEATTAPCGQVYQRVGSYVYCLQGSMTCTDSVWSECEGSRVQRVEDKGQSVRLLALGSSQDCGSNGLCNPYCSLVEDNAQGLTIDPTDDVTVEDDGVTLKQIESGGAVDTGCTSLSITPSVGTLNITKLSPLTPSTIQFTASVNPPGCYPGPLQVLWAVDRFDAATISPTGLVTLAGGLTGPINVTAYAGLLSAHALLNVTLNVLDTSAATATQLTRYNNATGTFTDSGLTALYPYPNTVFPLGIGAPLIQWTDTAATPPSISVVKISLRYPATGTPSFEWSQLVPPTQSIYLDPPSNSVPLAAGPRAQIPESIWNTFEQVAKGGTGAYVIQRVGSFATAPTYRKGAELVVPIKFATGQLKGTVYYQSYGTNLVANFGSTYQNGSTLQDYAPANRRFGAATLSIKPGATYPTVAAGYTSTDNGPGCRVCHTAAADGSKLVTNLHTTEGDRISTLFQLGTHAANSGIQMTPANGTYAVTGGLYAWPAIYPDGSFMFSNAGPGPVYNNLGTNPPPGGLEGSANTDKPNRLFSLSTSVSQLGRDISPTTTGYPAALRAATPVFSPVGNKLAFNHYAGTVGSGASSISGDKRSLGMMDFNPSTKQFSNFRRLVTENAQCSTLWGSTDFCTIVWPSFMPNNAGIVYERELFNNGRVAGATQTDFGGTRAGCGHATNACANDGTKAELWWTSIDSTPQAVRLNAANGRNSSGTLTIPTLASTSHTSTVEGVLNYEPTVNPQAVGGYYWVAFTSRRLYGNVATVNPWWSDPRYKPLAGSQGPTTKKIWVAAISENPTENTDPSAPAFYLPGQEYLAGNSKAYWVLDSCKTASSTRSAATECESDLDCCGAPTTSVCSLQTPIASPAKRHCIPRDASVCIPDGSTSQCFSDAQCCNFTSGSICANGTCQVPPTLSLYVPGTFTRDFVSECEDHERPVWQFFEWQAELPTGTSISFTAASAETSAELATATTVSAGQALPPSTTTWTNDGTNINDGLKAAQLSSNKFLRVTANLSPSSDQLSAPVLQNWRIVYDCVDAQ